jgi:NADH:ubiquinone oxidoreductase subunit 6 (subunit J)
MIALAVISAFLLASAALAFTRRNLIHSALLLVVTWAGIACFYLWAGAEFVAFAQVLIYVGAVSMIVLFAVLLTRRTPAEAALAPASLRRAAAALGAGGAVVAVLAAAIVTTPFGPAPARAPSVTVRQLGYQLMGPHAASLLVVGLLLTVALIGATILASTERREPGRPGAHPPEDAA